MESSDTKGALSLCGLSHKPRWMAPMENMCPSPLARGYLATDNRDMFIEYAAKGSGGSYKNYLIARGAYNIMCLKLGQF